MSSEKPANIGVVRAFDVDDFEFRTREVVCNRCANHCEIICVYKDDDLIDSWGNRCDRGAIRVGK